jgi:hypothetical protein
MPDRILHATVVQSCRRKLPAQGQALRRHHGAATANIRGQRVQMNSHGCEQTWVSSKLPIRLQVSQIQSAADSLNPRPLTARHRAGHLITLMTEPGW